MCPPDCDCVGQLVISVAALVATATCAMGNIHYLTQKESYYFVRTTSY